ncbi:hypothetical protein PROVRETT_08012 [Providencia rettgeri DSM 1131]|nr:hypothetical protein PROVRETT_08012 [Providencia rettgeri DSM 1131]
MFNQSHNNIHWRNDLKLDTPRFQALNFINNIISSDKVKWL